MENCFNLIRITQYQLSKISAAVFFRNILTTIAVSIALQVSAQDLKKDTVFILKDTTTKKSHSIFIVNNKESEFYEQITDFHFGSYDQESYNYSIDYLKEQKLKLAKSNPVIPWKNWVILKQYKGRFYVYHPSDFINHFQQSVNDTTFIDWTGEGPVANKIIAQKKIDKKTYEFKLTGIFEQDRKLIVHIIDAKKGIAVFEETTGTGDKTYSLMIAADKIKTVPIIVNYTPRQKEKELEFEVPDYKNFLRKK